MDIRLSDLPETSSLARLLDVVGHLETEQLDFKREPAKLHEIFAAMAMTRGGLVLIGINDRRELHGAALTQQLLDKLKRAGADTGVDIQLRELSVDESRVTVVAVPEVSGRVVTTPDGRLLRRVGSDNVPLRGDALARFVVEMSKGSAEEEPLLAVEAGEFDLDLVNTALRSLERPEVKEDGVFRALVDLGVADPQAAPADPQVTLAAGLLFGRHPTKWCRGASLQLIKRAGLGPSAGPTEERAEVDGPLPKVLDEALAFIQRHTRTYEVVIGRQRVRIPEYPTEALREAILNALAHRDYSLTGGTVDLTIWEDRVEITSPGSLPAPITVDNMRHQHYSRNRRIMQGLKAFGLVEEYGEGVDRMFEAMSDRLMDPPGIVATDMSVTVTLHNRILVSIEDQSWLAMLSHLSLSREERLAVALVHREGFVTRRRLLQLLPDADAAAVFRGATAKGLLVQTGRGGGIRYVMSPELSLRAGSSGVEAQSRKRQRLLDEIHRRGSISTAEGAVLLREDTTMVRHLLNDLVHAGLATAKGNTRARRYFPA